jgi:prolyl oligopeptidase
MDFAPSPDGRRVAYALQAGGSEIGTLHVVDVATGHELIAPVEGIRYASVAWVDDGSGFFYSRLPAGYGARPRAERLGDTQRRFRSLASDGVDRQVFGAGFDPALPLPAQATGTVGQIPGTAFALAAVSLGVDRSRLFYIADLGPATQGKAHWRPIATAADEVASVAAARDWIYLRTSSGAPRYRVVRVPLADPDLARAEVVVPESAGVVTAIAAAKDALYVTRRDGATLSLWRLPHGDPAATEAIALPFAGAVRIVDADPTRDGAIVSLGSWTRAAKHHAYDPVRRTLEPLPLVKPGSYDAPAGIAAREVVVKSHDGVAVPLSIIARSDVVLDGRNPTILYAYGAYGITEDPAWSPRLLAWLERGGVYAIAHVRGGGAFGEAWHRAGMKGTKPNTWLDGIAAAQWLIDQRYTSPSRLAVQGGSAGGIFAGRALTARPDLFAAAVISVGNTDLVRSETRANGAANVPEYGTVTREDEFRALLAMSPYASVRPGTAYPAVLFEHGVNDLRVDVWNSLKTASRLATATTSDRPVLLRLEYDGGHGAGATREQGLARTADRWAFLLWQFGDPAFAPLP